MAQERNYRVFPNKIEMLKFFGSYIPDLDVKTSARLAPFMYVYKGKVMVERNFILFLRAMEEISGLEIDESVSAMRGGSYIVFFKKEIPRPTNRGATITATVTPPVKKEEVTQPANADLAPVSEGDQNNAKIIEQALALNDESDKKGSKDKLAEFAAGMDITLNKTKTFENMIADLKTALSQ